MVEFFVLSGVSGFLWSNSINAGHVPISVFLLLNGPHISAYADEDTTLQIVLYSVYIVSFIMEVVLTGHGEGRSLR